MPLGKILERVPEKPRVSLTLLVVAISHFLPHKLTELLNTFAFEFTWCGHNLDPNTNTKQLH
jgi:hypothetical protein